MRLDVHVYKALQYRPSDLIESYMISIQELLLFVPHFHFSFEAA